jgi:hypothetical protein
MRGWADNNKRAFFRAATMLRQLGYDVLNPAEWDEKDPKPLNWDTPSGRAMGIRRDLTGVLKADMIALLDGWQLSVGASAEASVAEWAGKPAVFQNVDHTGYWFSKPRPLHLFTKEVR